MGEKDGWGQRTSNSASLRNRFCNISFVAKPSYIYDRNQNTIKFSVPIVQKKNKPRTSLRSSRTARCNGLGIAGRTL